MRVGKNIIKSCDSSIKITYGQNINTRSISNVPNIRNGSNTSNVSNMTNVQNSSHPNITPLAPVPPVEYVRINSDYGAGFYYVPGTDTAIEIPHGLNYLPRSSYTGQPTIEKEDIEGLNSFFHSLLSAIHYCRTTKKNIAGPYFDERTETEYGTLRKLTFLGLNMQINTDGKVVISDGSNIFGA